MIAWPSFRMKPDVDSKRFARHRPNKLIRVFAEPHNSIVVVIILIKFSVVGLKDAFHVCTAILSNFHKDDQNKGSVSFKYTYTSLYDVVA
jgi:hypothetical protein